jgi:energy-coupling factor transporter ATP-binding protein EcfA2
MYINYIVIENIRAIRKIHWDIRRQKKIGWHVLLGPNGSGKSSFVRTVALSMIGTKQSIALRQDWNTWLNSQTESGVVGILFSRDQDLDFFSGKGRNPNEKDLNAILMIKRHRKNAEITERDGAYKQIIGGSSASLNKSDPYRHIWGDNGAWFSASFGPFRRFSGGDKDHERIFLSNPKVARHLSAFGESVALTECLEWLVKLNYEKLESKTKKHPLLDNIIAFVNQSDFLPHNAKIEKISSKGVEFKDGNNNIVAVEELSDGYRSILSMTFELIRQMAQVYPLEVMFKSEKPEDSAKIFAPGVVQIDEVDAHLHPTWQAKIGEWFKTRFPNVQFIVTTHSPIICRAADTVFRLPAPGSDEEGKFITGRDLDRLRYGNLVDALATEAFGEGIERSEESRQMLTRLSELNMLELERELNADEIAEQTRLRSILPTARTQK